MAQKSALLLGPRRAGKSTYLKENFPDFDYVTLDDLDILDLAQRDPKAIVQGKTRLIIDEIQRAPRLTIAAKHIIDEYAATVLMSGSSRIGLLDASADTLAGRIAWHELPPMCWGESVGAPTHAILSEQASPLQLRDAQRQLDHFMQYGGFPEVVAAADDTQRDEILRNYKNTYFARDLSMLSNIENVTALRALLQYYAQSIGSITQVENFRRESGLSHVSAKKYLESVYQASLGFTVSGYQFGPAKRYIKGSKSYFCDVGMVRALNAQCSRGQIVEQFVVSEFEKRRKLGYYRCDQLHFYQSTSGFEVDLIIDEGSCVHAIEIKATTSPAARDVRNVQSYVAQDPERRRGYVLYLGSDYRELHGVQCIPIAALYRGR